MFTLEPDVKKRLLDTKQTTAQEVWDTYHTVVYQLREHNVRYSHKQVLNIFLRIFNKRGDI